MQITVNPTPKQQLLELIETLNDNQIQFTLTFLEQIIGEC